MHDVARHLPTRDELPNKREVALLTTLGREDILGIRPLREGIAGVDLNHGVPLLPQALAEAPTQPGFVHEEEPGPRSRILSGFGDRPVPTRRPSPVTDVLELLEPSFLGRRTCSRFNEVVPMLECVRGHRDALPRLPFPQLVCGKRETARPSPTDHGEEERMIVHLFVPVPNRGKEIEFGASRRALPRAVSSTCDPVRPR